MSSSSGLFHDELYVNQKVLSADKYSNTLFYTIAPAGDVQGDKVVHDLESHGESDKFEESPTLLQEADSNPDSGRVDQSFVHESSYHLLLEAELSVNEEGSISVQNRHLESIDRLSRRPSPTPDRSSLLINEYTLLKTRTHVDSLIPTTAQPDISRCMGKLNKRKAIKSPRAMPSYLDGKQRQLSPMTPSKEIEVYARAASRFLAINHEHLLSQSLPTTGGFAAPVFVKSPPESSDGQEGESPEKASMVKGVTRQNVIEAASRLPKQRRDDTDAGDHTDYWPVGGLQSAPKRRKSSVQIKCEGRLEMARAPLIVTKSSNIGSQTLLKGYPLPSAPLPEGLKLTEICNQYPNHLIGANLILFLQEGWDARKIMEHLPDQPNQSKRRKIKETTMAARLRKVKANLEK